MGFMVKNAGKTRIERRIVLSSKKCIRKAFAHYLWRQIKDGKVSWVEIKFVLKKEWH